MATTTNYSWTTPDDTALVKDGAAAIRSLGTAIDTTTKNLNPSTTLGDIEYRSSTANTNTRLAIGSNGQVLTVASGVPSWAAPAGGGKVLQVVQGTTSTAVTISTATLTDTGLTATITPSSATSKILVLASQLAYIYDPVSGGTIAATGNYALLRGATNILNNSTAFSFGWEGASMPGGSSGEVSGIISVSYLDSPSTTSATTYKLQARIYQGTDFVAQRSSNTSTIILLEIGA
jgi:molybdopterin-binding protein